MDFAPVVILPFFEIYFTFTIDRIIAMQMTIDSGNYTVIFGDPLRYPS